MASPRQKRSFSQLLIARGVVTEERFREASGAEELQKLVSEQEQAIENLEAQNTVRLYTGLIQGAIIVLIVGGVAAWVVSRRMRLVEVEENDHA